MSVNLCNVEAFYWAATSGSVQSAANTLHLSQSAVSTRIKVLEETELGVRLFERVRGQRLSLTERGLQFLEDAERLLNEWARIKSQFPSSGESVNILRIGVIESVLHTWLIPWLNQCRSAMPNLKLELTVNATESLVESLRHGLLHLVLSTRPAGGEHVQSLEFPSMVMCFAGEASAHKRRSYTIAELAQLDLLTFQRPSHPQEMLNQVLRHAGLTGVRVHTVSSISAMIELVKQGFGVATLPRALVEAAGRPEGLRVLPCTTTLPPLPNYASWRSDSLSQDIASLVEDARTFASTYEPPRP